MGLRSRFISFELRLLGFQIEPVDIALHGAETFAEQCAGTLGEREGSQTGGRSKNGSGRPAGVDGRQLFGRWRRHDGDDINRAMPMPAPHTLSADDVYALTAYILNLNDAVPNEFVADRDSLPKVEMSNRDNFI
jgi:S-disulfanyl-L-cysteine oxidoreductase SoxD